MIHIYKPSVPCFWECCFSIRSILSSISFQFTDLPFNVAHGYIHPFVIVATMSCLSLSVNATICSCIIGSKGAVLSWWNCSILTNCRPMRMDSMRFQCLLNSCSVMLLGAQWVISFLRLRATMTYPHWLSSFALGHKKFCQRSGTIVFFSFSLSLFL